MGDEICRRCSGTRREPGNAGPCKACSEWEEPKLPSLDPPLKGVWMEIRELAGEKWYPAYVAATNHQPTNGGIVAEYTMRIVMVRTELLKAIDQSPGYVALRKELGVE